MGKLISLGIIIGLGIVALVVSQVLSRDALGLVIGLLFGMLSVFPGLWVILAQRASGEQPPVQRPAPPSATVLPAPRGLLVDVDGEWHPLD